MVTGHQGEHHRGLESKFAISNALKRVHRPKARVSADWKRGRGAEIPLCVHPGCYDSSKSKVVEHGGDNMVPTKHVCQIGDATFLLTRRAVGMAVPDCWPAKGDKGGKGDAPAHIYKLSAIFRTLAGVSPLFP
jgi:hypothetical protein